MTTLLLMLMFAVPQADCALTQQAATTAYAEARKDAIPLEDALRALRAARTCLLAEGDTAEAALKHVQEIYLLSIAGQAQPYQASINYFFETFEPHHQLARYTYVMRKQATLDAARGNTAEAFAILNRCLAMTPRTWPRERAETHLRLAELYRWHNQYHAATIHLRAARTLIDRHLTGSERERQRVRALINLSEMLLQWYALEDVGPSVLQEARESAQEAFSLRAYASASDQVHVYHLLGDVLTYAGETEQAAELLATAVRENAGGDQYEYMMAQYRLGRNRLRSANLGAARIALEAAYQAALQQGDLTWARRIRHDQGRLEVRAQSFDRAKAHYREAISLVEDLRAEIGTSEWAASSVSDWQAPYRGLARALLAQDSVQAALDVLEQSRARHLLALRARLSRLGSLSASDASTADSLMAALSSVRNVLQTATPEEATALHAETAALQARLNVLFGPPPPRTALDLPALQQRLKAENRSVLYYVLDREDRLFADEHLAYAFLLRSDTLQVLHLSARPEQIAANIAAVAPALQSDTVANSSSATAFSLNALYRLHQTLVQPFARLIAQDAPLTIIPDGALFALPFAALVTEPVGRFAYTRASYLGANHAITTDLSLRAALPRPLRTGTLDLLAVGKRRFSGSSLAPLPGVGPEVKAVTNAFGRTRALLDGRATEAAFAHDAGRSRAIHFATHARLNASGPLYHALVLTAADGSDALLHLHEIEQMNLQAELVTLSGCNTARGTVNAGEGMAGLQYAFRAVGARSTVSTLWNLSDEAGPELFGTFYDLLSTGVANDVALQQAQQAYRQAHVGASPFFWASPVLYGAPDAFPPSQPVASSRWLLLALGLVLLGLLVWGLRHFQKASTRYAAQPPV